MDTNDDLAAANLYDGDTPGDGQPAYNAAEWWQAAVGRRMPTAPLLTDQREPDQPLERHRVGDAYPDHDASPYINDSRKAHGVACERRRALNAPWPKGEVRRIGPSVTIERV